MINLIYTQPSYYVILKFETLLDLRQKKFFFSAVFVKVSSSETKTVPTTSCRRRQDAYYDCIQDVCTTSWKRREHHVVLSTLRSILRRQHWTSARRLTDVINTTSCSRRLQDVVNMTSFSTSARRRWESTKRRLCDVVFRRRRAIFLTSCRRLIIWRVTTSPRPTF